MRTQPEFTHAELLQLWHAISQYVDNADPEDPEQARPLGVAELAREKLDCYVERAANVEAELLSVLTVNERDIAALEQEAAQAGDTETVSLCQKASSGVKAARARCEKIILDWRAEKAAQ